MIGIASIVRFRRFASKVFRAYLAGGVFTGDFRQAAVHFVLFLSLAFLWIKLDNIHHLRIAVFGGQLPTDFHNGTVYLDAEEVFRLPGNLQGGTECNHPVDVRSDSFTQVGIARPPTFAFPCQVVGGLAVLHDSRNTVVIIGRHVVVGGGFFFGLCQFRLLPAHGGEFRFYPADFVLIVVIGLPEHGGFLHGGGSYLPDKFRIFRLQPVYPGLQHGGFPVVFLFQFVQAGQVQFIIFRYGCPHHALLGVCVQAASATAAFVLGGA